VDRMLNAECTKLNAQSMHKPQCPGPNQCPMSNGNPNGPRRIEHQF